MAAIEAAPNIRPKDARRLLRKFTDSDDYELGEAAMDALSMAGEDDSFD